MIPVTNKGNLTVNNPNTAKRAKQNLTYSEIVSIMIVDYNMMALKANFNETLAPYFTTEVVPYMNTSFIKSLVPYITESVSQSDNSTKIFGIAISLSTLLLVIPIALFLRKRFALHEKVFDLMASVDAEAVADEVKSLLYVSNIVNNYQESEQKLQNNVISYQENRIRPRNDTGQRGSVNNELVIGLEKMEVDNISQEV